MKRNIKVSYIYNFFVSLDITSAIWVLYLSSKGMSLAQIGLLESIFHVTSAIFEVPTGVIADRYGRKLSVLIGRAFAVISTIVMIKSNGFLGFAVGFILSALSYNMDSGANEALIYDSLKLLGLEKSYTKIYGTISSIVEAAQGIAVLLGGILSDVRFIYAYLLGLIIQCLALIAASFYREPVLTHEEGNKNSTLHNLKQSFVILRDRKLVLYLIIFFAAVSSIDATIYFYSQKYFENMKLSRTVIAVVYAFTNVIAAFGAKYAYSIEKRIKRDKLLVLLPIIDVVILFGLSISSGFQAIGIFICISLVRGTVTPIFSEYINSMIPSEFRATILSFDSLSFSIAMLSIFPLTGFIGDMLGLRAAYAFIAVIFIPAIVFINFRLKRHI